jgi:hypothetical protein
MIRSSFSSLGTLRGTVLVGWWDLFLLSLSVAAKNRNIAKIVVFKQSENERLIEIINEQRYKEQKRKRWIELKWKKGRC